MEKMMRFPDRRSTTLRVRLARPFRVTKLADGTKPVMPLVATPVILTSTKALKVGLAMEAPTQLRPRSPGKFQPDEASTEIVVEVAE